MKISFLHRPVVARRTDQGFALVVALVLLSFILLLLLSLTTLTRIETFGAATTQKLSEARQNALFGLELALGELQKNTGPDQRVTAPADILAASSNSSNTPPYWVGVWQQNPSGTTRDPQLLTWLVSGNENGINLTPDTSIPNPSGKNSATVWLVGEGSVQQPEQRIKLPRQTITGPDGSTQGHYAWWVADENMKANLSLVDPAPSRSANEQKHSFIVAQRTGAERIPELGDSYPSNDRLLQQLMSPKDLPLLGKDPGESNLLADATDKLFHDITTYSRGLLTDTLRGGLKKDLTAWLRGTSSPNAPKDDDFIVPPVGSDSHGLPRWGLIRSYNELRDNGSPINPKLHTDKEHGLHPVVTYAFLGIAPSNLGHGMPFRVQLFPIFLLWNPTSVTLKATQYEVGIAISNPTATRISFYQESVSDSNHLGTLHLGRAELSDTSGASNSPERYFRFTVNAPDMPPGASMMFTVSDADVGEDYEHGKIALVANASNPYGNYAVMTSGRVVNFSNPQMDPSELPEDFFVWKMEPSSFKSGGRLDVALRLKPGTPDDPIGYDFGGDYLHLVSKAGYTGPADRTTGWTDEAVTPTWRVRAEVAMRGGASMVKAPWISLHNMSAPSANRALRDNSQNPLYLGGVAPLSSWPDSAIASTAEPHTAHNPTSYRRMSVGENIIANNGKPRDVVLREILRTNEPLLSLGQLTHANLSLFSLYPTWPLGNSLASYRIALTATSDNVGTFTVGGVPRVYDLSYLLNTEIWDRFFLSTLSEDDIPDNNPASYTPPNARIQIASDATKASLTGPLAYDTAASHLSVDGAFNINSTSKAAWVAMLSSLNGLEYDPVKDSSGPALENPFSRYSTPSTDDGHFWSKTYRQLTPAQIDDLAERIVKEVKERGPFLSLSDFINRRLENSPHGFKGALQAAIDSQSATPASSVPAINHWADFPTNAIAGKDPTGAGNMFLPQLQGGDASVGYAPQHPWNSRFAFAPGYLTQADILTALGPSLTARGDTFIVRSYGDVTNPVSGNVEARAWCEAVVQRTPEYVDPSLPSWENPTGSSVNDRFGRAYKILSIRWLAEDEI